MKYIDNDNIFIKFNTIIDSNDYYEIRPGVIKRSWMDETYNYHAYKCKAITDANLYGWEIILPHEVIVTWNGKLGTSSENVKILKGEKFNSISGEKYFNIITKKEISVAGTGTANGTVTFHLNSYVETDKDHCIFLSGPPNYFIEGASPMNAIIESDWYSNTPLTFCWKLNKINEEIIFPKGMPFVFIYNYPINLGRKTAFSVNKLSNEKIIQAKNYLNSRNEEQKNKNKPFALFYSRGLKEGLKTNEKKINSQIVNNVKYEIENDTN